MKFWTKYFFESFMRLRLTLPHEMELLRIRAVQFLHPQEAGLEFE